MSHPDQELLEEAFAKAENRLRDIAADKIPIQEFSRQMNMLQIEATHTLALLILNSWLMNKRKGQLYDYSRIVIRGIEADLKTLANAEAEGALDSAPVVASQDEGEPDGAA